jgi:hypothetical protein
LYSPLGQSVHLVEPTAEDRPAAQLAQVSMAPVLPWNLPAGHGLQVPVTVSLYLPIGQAPQADDEVEATGEKYPVGQLTHEVWPVLPWNLLPGQAVQVLAVSCVQVPRLVPQPTLPQQPVSWDSPAFASVHHANMSLRTCC